MSRLRINPPVATVYPNDRQVFTAEAEAPPPLWVVVGNSGDIKSDFSLEVDPAGTDTFANSAHLLYSGIGIIEFTIDDQCRPTTGGFFQFAGFIHEEVGFDYAYLVRINPTNVEIRDEDTTLLLTDSYSTVSGDVYRLELVAGFRLYRNGTLIHERINLATKPIFPHFFSVQILEPTASAPTRVPPPKLIGDWRLGPNVTWTTPAHGFLTATGLSKSVEYFDGVTPGIYTLIAQIEPAADAGNVQRATAKIEIPPLQILGPTEITMQPGAKIRPKTNYDAAKSNKLVTWTANFGSFTQDEYTAPTDPGVSIMRATADVNDQVADITVTVPAVITNPGGFTAAKPSEEIDFATNIPASVIPRFISAGTVVAGTGNIQPGMPPGVQDGDFLLVVVESANEVVATPAGGWVVVPDSLQGTGSAGAAGSTRLSCFSGRWIPGLAAPTVVDPGDHVIAQIFAFRGCPLSGDAWNVTAGNTAASSTAVSIPGDTTTVANCLVVTIVTNATDTATNQTGGFTNTDLSSVTQIGNANTPLGVGGGFGVAIGGKAAEGAYGATTATLATASAQACMSIALKPGPIVWSESIGSIDTATGEWTAPSLAGQTARIRVTDGIFSAIIEFPVLKTFPITRTATPVEGERRKKILISEAEDGTEATRVKNKDGQSRQYYSVRITLLTLAEFNTVVDFWEEHHPSEPFIWEDIPQGIRGVFKFDSDMVWRETGSGRFEVAFRVKEITV